LRLGVCQLPVLRLATGRGGVGNAAVLSKKFYEKFGEDVTNELVNWFNAVDATYRADLRELNELNFARFRAELCAELTRLRAELKVEFAEELRRLETRLVRWMLGLWISTLLGLGALFFRT
jgi:hypothetical protein